MTTADSAAPFRHPLFIAALVAGISYFPATKLVDAALLPDGAWMVAWKGAGVALLALWARVLATTRDGRVIAAVLALGALGDVLLEVMGLVPGAVAFLAGHVLAIWLYARHRRAGLSSSQALLGWVVAPATTIAALALSGGDAGVGLYAAGLGSMAACAWTSRFPRYRAGLGAMLFVVSDLLIFSRMGPLAGSVLPDLLIWPTYFGGQALIAAGVVPVLLRQDQPGSRT